jgi:hypothetical protein
MAKEKEEDKPKGKGGDEAENDKGGDKSKDKDNKKDEEEKSPEKIRYAVRDDIVKGEGPTPFYVANLMFIINLWLFLYDCLTFLFYAVFNNPAEKLRRSKRQKVTLFSFTLRLLEDLK